MSQRAEKLRAFIEAFNRHDFDDAVGYLHPEVEIYPAIGGVLDVSRCYRGRDEGRHLLETISEGVQNKVEIEDVIDAGERQVLQVERWHARGRQGIETPVEIGTIYTFRDGLVVRLEGFRDRDEALKAAGLSESAMSQENAEFIQASFEAWNAGNMDAVREDYDPDAILRRRKVGRSQGRSWAGRLAYGSWSNSARPGTPTPWNRSASSSPSPIELS